MKILKIIGLLLIAGVLFSCEKDIKEEKMGEVSFGIEHVDPFDLKSDSYDIECPADLDPVKAKIVIEDIEDPFYPLVFFLNGRWYTQAIKLAPGNYTINEFYLLDANDNILMATPAEGSVFAPYVDDNTVAIDFEVKAFEKTEFKMWVLCYEEANYDAFGFFWFRLNRIVVREKCFFGDLCVKNPDDYIGSLYANQSTGLQIDMPAIFEIRAFRKTVDEDEEIVLTALPYSPFTNATAEADWGVGAPVCVQWPDNIDIAGEEFIFELWIYVAVGSGFDYVHFHTWTFEDDAMVAYNGDQVIDFVLGSCNYSDTYLQLAPYMNLPTTINMDIAHNANGTPWYWDINVNSVIPTGSYDIPSSGFLAGWCGDGTVTINPGNDKTFSVYSSLYPALWPAGIPAYITAAKFNKVNWLFNNLSNYGITISGTFIDPTDNLTVPQGKTIQNAIWRIINEGMGGVPYFTGTDVGNGENMAADAQSHTTFVPLPGGWAAVLLVPHVDGVPDATKAQLLFTVVDP